MPYVIKSTKKDASNGQEYSNFFIKETMFGMANEMGNIDNATKYEFLTEARRVQRKRFAGAKHVKIEKV